MRKLNRRFRRTVLLGGVVLLVGGCASQGPSLKQRADEAAERKKANKADEEFARSLPPTDSKPIFKP